ncbi:adenylate kinase 4 [Anaeramoeba flamelloides]|uniref:Adenylate kinase 4 n=1 Tax=Anaeramoeba flamelloides TaxID=1746091 RepID=A0ABQ8XMA0_9EUKA|nr:adenylate kinase 4 [Anaeramoeba flamelloides]
MQKCIFFSIIGPPGSGKGTLAQFICQKYGFTHLSTGDLIREAVRKQTKVGLQIQEIKSNNQLITNEIIGELLKERLSTIEEGGVVFDGFPRKFEQLRILEEALQSKGPNLSLVIQLMIDRETIEKRITGRLIHPKSGRIYHEIYNPPKVTMKDDITGEQLVRRNDDEIKKLAPRIERYQKFSKPIIEHFTKLQLLFTIDSSQEKQAMFNQAVQKFEQLNFSDLNLQKQEQM